MVMREPLHATALLFLVYFYSCLPAFTLYNFIFIYFYLALILSYFVHKVVAQFIEKFHKKFRVRTNHVHPLDSAEIQ